VSSTATIERPGGDAPSLQEQFERFHQDNPRVYTVLEQLARRWLAGHSQVGIGMLWEVMRWQLGVETNTTDYRLNNNHRSRYARLLLAEHPEWAGRIKTRELRAA